MSVYPGLWLHTYVRTPRPRAPARTPPAARLGAFVRSRAVVARLLSFVIPPPPSCHYGPALCMCAYNSCQISMEKSLAGEG